MLRPQRPPALFQYPARPATGADIPPELFPRILEYLGTDDTGKGEDWERAWGEGLRDLKSCSLVCVDWANRCRPVMPWKGITVRLQEQMESLDFYAKHGSKRLVPIASLIPWWELEQTWASRSWCHLRYNSSFRLMNPEGLRADAYNVKLQGPVPSSLPVFALHSPHWSLPRSMPACYTSFSLLRLTDIHFPSLSSLFKLVRHFKSLRWLYLQKTTWDQVEVMAPAPRGRISGLDVRAYRCTDNVYAPVSLAALCPSNAFWRLCLEERHACLAWVQNGLVPPSAAIEHTEPAAGLLLGARNNPDTLLFVSMACSIETLGSAFRIDNYLGQPSNSHEGSDSEKSSESILDLRAIAIPLAPIPSSFMQVHVLQLKISFGSHPCRVQSLQSLAEQLPALRLMVLWFRSDFSLLKAAVDANPALCESLSSTQDIIYRFLCERSKEHPFEQVPKVSQGYNSVVEIDPITMEPTGLTWEDDYMYKAIKQMVNHYLPKLVPLIPDFEAIK